MSKEDGSVSGPVELRPTTDDHARDIRVGGDFIGTLRWHRGNSVAKVVLSANDLPLEFPLSVLKELVEKSQEVIAPEASS